MPFDSSGTFNRAIPGGWQADRDAGTKITALRHDAEDDGFATGLSTTITRTGVSTVLADIPWNNKKLTQLGEPTNPTDAATKNYVDTAITSAAAGLALPPGVMMPYTKVASVPAGWLYCNGQAISRATYAALFALIGTQFGVGDGASTFNLPDMRGQFLRGWADNQTVLDSGRAFGSKQDDLIENHIHPATGASGGISANHTHAFSGSGSTDTVGAHQHAAGDAVLGGSLGGSGLRAYSGSGTTGYTAGAGSHNHSVSVSGTTGNVSSDHNHAITVAVQNNTGGGAETRPTNIALVWIIKT